MVSIMFLNKSKEITKKKIPEVNTISTTFLTPFVEEEKVGSSLCQGEQWTPRFLVDHYFEENMPWKSSFLQTT